MEHVSVEDLENLSRSAAVTKRLTGPLGLANVAINYYELEPGDSLSGGIHTHTNQEEAFFVLEGEATFETLDGTHLVGPNEAVRFAPGEYQEGRNESEDRVRVIALGAPQESGEIRVPVACRECGGSDYHITHVHEDGFTFECPECGNTFQAG